MQCFLKEAHFLVSSIREKDLEQETRKEKVLGEDVFESILLIISLVLILVLPDVICVTDCEVSTEGTLQ